MKVIVDTNIVFSALVNTQSTIADLLLNSGDIFDFHSCYLLLEEIQKHRTKLLEYSGMSEKQLDVAQYQILSTIQLISEGQFPFSIWQTSIALVRDVDMDDVAFVALNEYLDAKLWSGDKKLIEGLKAKGYDKLLTTNELLELREKADAS